MKYILLSTFDAAPYAGRVISRHYTLGAAKAAAKELQPSNQSGSLIRSYVPTAIYHRGAYLPAVGEYVYVTALGPNIYEEEDCWE